MNELSAYSDCVIIRKKPIMSFLFSIKRAVLIFNITLIFFLMPLSASGQDKKNYAAVKTGLYTFTGGLEDSDFVTGFNGEIAIGHYLHSNIALEAGACYIHDGIIKGRREVRFVQIPLTAKGIYPLGNVEAVYGGGIGVNFAKLRGEFNGLHVDDRDTVFGGHLLLGANFNISHATFIGIEGKYNFTEKARFNSVETNLNGYSVSANLGFRF